MKQQKMRRINFWLDEYETEKARKKAKVKEKRSLSFKLREWIENYNKEK